MSKKILIIGSSGMGLTGCQLLHLSQIAEDMAKVGVSLAEALGKIAIVSPDTTMSMSEFIKSAELVGLADNPLSHKKEKKPKYIRQQHKLAVKFSNRRR